MSPTDLVITAGVLIIPASYIIARVVCQAYFQAKLWYHFTLMQRLNQGAKHGEI